MTRYPARPLGKEIFRQITQANVAVVAADGDILNDAVELKIIPRPRVGHQLRQRVIVHFQSRRETLLRLFNRLCTSDGILLRRRAAAG